MWTIRQACFLLAGQNPEPIDKDFSQEAALIYKLLDQDYLSGKIKLIEQKNLLLESKLVGKNSDFIA